MTRPFHPAASPDMAGPRAATPGAGRGAAPATLITADASKVSGRAFLDALTGNSPEKRAARREQEIESCIRAIERGDVYGWPPVMVAECRHIMAMRGEVRL